MTDDRSHRLLNVSREYFGLVALDPEAEGLLGAACEMVALIRDSQPDDADDRQWSIALATTAAAMTFVNNRVPPGVVTREQMNGVRAAVLMVGMISYLLGDGQ